MDRLKDYFIILLSAGSGSRMKNISKNTPKSILKIGKSSPLDILIKKLEIRGAKEINIVLGFEYRKILKKLRNYKNIKIRYVVINDFINNGSVWSLYKSYNLWKIRKKKRILMFHTDLLFSSKFLDNIIKSKKKDIIGVRYVRKQKFKKESFVVEVNKLMKVKKIGKLPEVDDPYGEIICINKFSHKTFKKLIQYLKNYFRNNSKSVTWEYPLSEFAKICDLFILKNQKFKWININTKKDLLEARRRVG